MAKLRDIFLKGVETAFSTFEEAVNEGTYNVVDDNGIDSPTSSVDEVRCIFEKFTTKDITMLSFASMIQPQDIKGLIPSVDIINCEMTTQGYALFNDKKYTVEAYDLDPMNVLYTVLLRKVK